MEDPAASTNATAGSSSIRTTYLDSLFSQSSPDAITIVNTVIQEAIKLRASDILFEPEGNGLSVRIRVDGVMYKIGEVELQGADFIIARIKVLAKLDHTSSQRVQEGQFTYIYENKSVNLRVEIARTIQGDLVVIRIHEKKSIIMDLAQLGFNREAFETYVDMVNNQSGLLLVCGPTGSGKTTTLYSTISKLSNEKRYNILTIEDPVEYKISGVNQMQTDQKSGFTFAVGLRTILRLSPDVVLVGEIRDRETAEIAVESGLTGQLVLSTTHARNCVGTVFRLLDLDIEPYFLNSALVGVVAQRLVRKICDFCKESYTPNQEQSDFFMSVLGRRPQQLFRGKGCPACDGVGFKGRVGIYEVLRVDASVQELIRSKLAEDQFHKILKDRGFLTLLRDGMQKSEQGVTTIEEIARKGILK